MVGESGTVTVTKSPDLAETDLVIDIDADGITPSINQETGVITLSVDVTTLTGDYVAEISCGEAEPKEITITVTAPTVTEIAYSGTGVIKMTALNRDITLNLGRLPMFSQGAMTYELSDYEDCFTITQTPNQSWDTRNLSYKDKFVFRQTTATSATQDIPITFRCGDATLNLVVHPYA